MPNLRNAACLSDSLADGFLARAGGRGGNGKVDGACKPRGTRAVGGAGDAGGVVASGGFVGG